MAATLGTSTPALLSKREPGAEQHDAEGRPQPALGERGGQLRRRPKTPWGTI